MYSKNGDRWKEDFTTIGRTGSKGIQKEKEGDKKSPSGIYGLHTPFGIRTNPGCPMASVSYTHLLKVTSGLTGTSEEAYFLASESSTEESSDKSTINKLEKKLYDKNYKMCIRDRP